MRKLKGDADFFKSAGIKMDHKGYPTFSPAHLSYTGVVPSSKLRLRAFHGIHDLKVKAILDMELHHDIEALIPGTYWEKGNSRDADIPHCARQKPMGCAVACLTHASRASCQSMKRGFGHELLPSIYGIPVTQAYMIDFIFENCGPEYWRVFPSRWLDSIPVGADLSNVHRSLALRILDPDEFMAGNKPTGYAKRAIKAYKKIAYDHDFAKSKEVERLIDEIADKDNLLDNALRNLLFYEVNQEDETESENFTHYRLFVLRLGESLSGTSDCRFIRECGEILIEENQKLPGNED